MKDIKITIDLSRNLDNELIHLGEWFEFRTFLFSQLKIKLH